MSTTADPSLPSDTEVRPRDTTPQRNADGLLASSQGSQEATATRQRGLERAGVVGGGERGEWKSFPDPMGAISDVNDHLTFHLPFPRLTFAEWSIPQAKAVLSSWCVLSSILAGTSSSLLSYYLNSNATIEKFVNSSSKNQQIFFSHGPLSDLATALTYAALVLDIYGALLAASTLVASISLQRPAEIIRDAVVADPVANEALLQLPEATVRRELFKRPWRRKNGQGDDEEKAGCRGDEDARVGASDPTGHCRCCHQPQPPPVSQGYQNTLSGQRPAGLPTTASSLPLNPSSSRQISSLYTQSQLAAVKDPLSLVTISILDRLTVVCGWLIPLAAILELLGLILHTFSLPSKTSTYAKAGLGIAFLLAGVTTSTAILGGWISADRRAKHQKSRSPARSQDPRACGDLPSTLGEERNGASQHRGYQICPPSEDVANILTTETAAQMTTST